MTVIDCKNTSILHSPSSYTLQVWFCISSHHEVESVSHSLDPGWVCDSSECRRGDRMPILSLDSKRLCGLSGFLNPSCCQGNQLQVSLCEWKSHIKCKHPSSWGPLEWPAPHLVTRWPNIHAQAHLGAMRSAQSPELPSDPRLLKNIPAYYCLALGVCGYLLHGMIMAIDNSYSVSESCFMKINYGTS